MPLRVHKGLEAAGDLPVLNDHRADLRNGFLTDLQAGGLDVESYSLSPKAGPDGNIVKRAEAWGHPAIAITDHGVVQGFPDAWHSARDIKILYGMEGYFVNKSNSALWATRGRPLTKARKSRSAWAGLGAPLSI